MISAFLANFLTYPDMHVGTCIIIKNTVTFFFYSKEYKIARDQFSTKIEAMRLLLKELYENENKQEYDNLLRNIDKFGEICIEKIIKSFDIDDERRGELEQHYNKAALPLLYHISIPTFLIVTTAISMLGLYNFYDLSVAAAGAIEKQTKIPYNKLPDVLIEVPSYLSMFALTLVIMKGTATDFMDYLFNKKANIEPTLEKFCGCKCHKLILLIGTIILCTIGGSANAYQAFIDQEPLSFILLAGIASFLLEIYGFYQYSKNRFTSEDISAELKEYLKINKNLERIRDDGFEKYHKGNESTLNDRPKYNCFGEGIKNACNNFCNFFKKDNKENLLEKNGKHEPNESNEYLV